MRLNEPKWAQKILNIFKMILYELKIGLNEFTWVSPNMLKSAYMSSNEPQWAQILIKILPVMHIQCKTWHILRVLKRRNKYQKLKKKKTFLWLIFIKLFTHALLSDALQFTSRVLYQMKDLIKLHNPDKFLEDSSFGSNFRDLQILA